MYKYKANKQRDSFVNLLSPLSRFDRSLSYKIELNHSLRLRTYPSYSLPRFWNSLNLEIKRSRSLKKQCSIPYVPHIWKNVIKTTAIRADLKFKM